MLDARNTSSTGFVWLVGAGPGASDLITVRGLRLLQGAEAVVYDELANADLLKNCPASCELHSVGKRAGRHNATQDEINALLVSLAQAGRKVVRLKGGDPMVFGRAGEEIEALRADIRQLKRGSPRRAQLEYFYFANTSPAQIDENGRISIPQALRDQLGLGEDARFVGYGERFEIWNRDTYTEVRGKSISGLIKAHGLGYSPFALFEEADEERA